MRTVEIFPNEYPELSNVLMPDQPVPSEDDFALAAISKPDGSTAWRYWFIPGPGRYVVGEAGRDAWQEAWSDTIWTVPAGNTLAQSNINGQPSVLLSNTAALLPAAGQGAVNPTEMTALFVLKPAPPVGAQYLLGAQSGTAIYGVPNLMVTGTQFSTYMGDDDTILSHPASDYLTETPKLLGVTLSVSRGVTLRRNGVKVAGDETRTMPIANPACRLFSTGSSSSRYHGDVGHVCVLDVDLTAPEHAADLARIESYLMNLYGITPGS